MHFLPSAQQGSMRAYVNMLPNPNPDVNLLPGGNPGTNGRLTLEGTYDPRGFPAIKITGTINRLPAGVALGAHAFHFHQGNNITQRCRDQGQTYSLSKFSAF